MVKRRKGTKSGGDFIPLPGPLDKQIEGSKIAKKKFRLKKASNEHKMELDLLERPATAILSLARKQLHEEVNVGPSPFFTGHKQKVTFSKSAKDIASESDQSDEEFVNNDICQEELEEIDPHQEQAFNKFRRIDVKDGEKHRTFSDFVQESLLRKEGDFDKKFGLNDQKYREMHPDVVQLFKEVGQVLSTYRTGKVPKAFKVIPSMANWEQILELTSLEKWSAASVFYATKLFAATANPSTCQRFYNLVLLPRVRDDIGEFKKLNYHLYQSLFKAMFKPAAFIKGLLLPLIKNGSCTLREVIIFGSVLKKHSIPQLHAAAAILNIADMEYSSASSYILRVLIEKNYALPFRCIDGLVSHFLRMQSYRGEHLPLLWHQALLSFLQRYAKDISTEQKDSLRALIKIHSHYLITPEMHKVLQDSECRNESDTNVPDHAQSDMF